MSEKNTAAHSAKSSPNLPFLAVDHLSIDVAKKRVLDDVSLALEAGEMPDVHEDMRALLEVTDVKKSFDTPRGRQEVLRGVSLRLAPGEVCGIVGASGSGKSTLFRIIAGLDAPDEGTVQKNGVVRMVFQDPREAFSPRMQMRDFFRTALEKAGETKDALESRILAMLAEVHLAPAVLAALPHQLSGGELQRVIIARTLLQEPDIVLFDEPTSALDVITQKEILDLIAALRRRFRFAGLFVGHELGAVQHVAERIYVLADGRFVETLAAKDLAHAKHEATLALLHASELLG